MAKREIKNMSNNDLSGRRILVVEDSPNIRRVLERILLEFGADQVLTASDGLAAITEVENLGARISLIACDLDLPRMDGTEFIRWLRASRNPEIPVLAFTGRGDREQMHGAVTAGIEGMLVIPVKPAVLVQHVQSAMRGRRIEPDRLKSA